MSKNKEIQKSKKTYRFTSLPYKRMYKQATDEIDQLKKEIDQLKKTIEIQESIISYTKNIVEEEHIKNNVVEDIYNNIILIDDYFTDMGYNIKKHLKKYNHKK
jgi:hypothetical protein